VPGSGRRKKLKGLGTLSLRFITASFEILCPSQGFRKARDW
jgi:hypothetical protein